MHLLLRILSFWDLNASEALIAWCHTCMSAIDRLTNQMTNLSDQPTILTPLYSVFPGSQHDSCYEAAKCPSSPRGVHTFPHDWDSCGAMHACVMAQFVLVGRKPCHVISTIWASKQHRSCKQSMVRQSREAACSTLQCKLVIWLQSIASCLHPVMQATCILRNKEPLLCLAPIQMCSYLKQCIYVLPYYLFNSLYVLLYYHIVLLSLNLF